MAGSWPIWMEEVALSIIMRTRVMLLQLNNKAVSGDAVLCCFYETVTG